MLRKFLFVVAAIALIPTITKADFKAGDLELTLAGSGASNKQLTTNSISLNGSLGYFMTKDLELSLRQSASYSKIAHGGDLFSGSTRVAVDYHFDLGNFRPFVGGNLGYAYGTHGFSDSWEIAPEAGVKYFMNATTFLYGQIEYQIFFRNGNGPSFNQGSFVYSLGLGLILK
jgi:outer membrane protein W